MLNNIRFPQQVKIRVPLPLYGSNVGRADIIIKRRDGQNFELQPFGYRPTNDKLTSVAQWYLKCSVPVEIQVQVQTTADRSWQRDDLYVEYSSNQPLELGLGIVTDSEFFTVMHGAISIPLTFYNDINKDQSIRRLWITNDTTGILSLIVESSGLYLRGLLPEEFYLNKELLPVVLRVPQTEADVVKAGNSINQSFPDLNLSGKWFWTLTAQKVTGHLDAKNYTKQYCAERVENFRLPNLAEGKRQLDTFIDNVDSQPGLDCIIKFFYEEIKNEKKELAQQISWIGQSLKTRMTIGGGTTAEASFQAPFLTGYLQREQNAPWKLNSIQFESARTTTQPPDIIVTLSQQVEFSFTDTQVQALSIPTTNLSDNIYRAWLCVDSGWLAIDSSGNQAEINPEINSQGAIFGVIEIDKLLQGFHAKSKNADNPITGFQLQVATLQNSRVVVKLSYKNNNEILSLEIYNPMATVITPNVWFNLKSSDSINKVAANPHFIPSLTLGVEVNKPVPNDDKTTIDNTIDSYKIEKLIKENLLPGVFVSANVVKSQKNLPVTATISWAEEAFKFQFKHNNITNNSNAPLQKILLWNRPVNYPIVQSFPISPIKDESIFLDANRGLIPYQPQLETSISINFPKYGLPQCLPTSPSLINPTSWEIVTDLITSKYFLPTLPGIELNLNKPEIQWVYRHSVPVLDEAYAEVSESQSEILANTGNIEGRDFTRVVGTQAFQVIPNSASQKAFGWIHKTSSNQDGSIEIEIQGNDTTLLEQLKGKYPSIDLTLKHNQRSITKKFSRNENTGGLTIPLKTNLTPASNPRNLPEFTVELVRDVTKDTNHYPSIINNGQSLIASSINADTQKVITLDGEGLVQAETIGKYTSYKNLNQNQNRRITQTFTLQPEICLEVIGISLGKFSKNEDLYQQSWTLHDAKGGWAKLAGFPLYPLCLREISEKDGVFYIQLEAILLYSTPSNDLNSKPNTASGALTLTFTGNKSNWYSQYTGNIDWRFTYNEDTNSEPQLARLQASLKSQQSGVSGNFEFENLQLAITHQIGLISLSQLSGAICIISNGVLEYQIPETKIKSFQFKIAKNSITVDHQPLEPIKDYSFQWFDPNSASQNIELISGEALRVPGAKGKIVETKILLEQRDADFINEFGLFKVDDSQGRIGELTPDSPQYAVAALSPERRLATFPANTQQLTVNLEAGEWVGTYLIQNDTSQNFLQSNPNNSILKRPLAFFSFIAANPDARTHVGITRTEQGVKLAWEDTEDGADSDFNDLIVDIKFMNLVWDLKLEPKDNKSEWRLSVNRGLELIDLQLQPYSVGSSKFIFQVKSALPEQENFALVQNAWFKRFKPDSGLLAVEFDISQQGLPTLKTMIADLQLYLTDKQVDINDDTTNNVDNTSLVLRLKLNLESSKFTQQFDVEASGQITLNNAIRFEDSTTECKHLIKFYFDRAKLSELSAFQMLNGEASTEKVVIAGIAHHHFTFGNDNNTVEWQSPQTIRFITLEEFANRFLGIPKLLPKELIFFETDRIRPTNQDQIQVLQIILEILQQNPEATVEIEGHSDSQGRPEVKQRVSEQRASAIKDWFVENNIEPSRLTSRGLSDFYPIADNSTIQGRRQNRRVEVTIQVIEIPDIPLENKSNLVIEASGVLEIKEDSFTSATTKAQTPDIENKFISLSIRAREIEQSQQSQAAHIVRLPFAACSENNRTLNIWPKIILQVVNQDFTYQSFGIQRYTQIPNLSFNTQTVFEIFQRTTQAEWLKSTYLQQSISSELQPAFLNENGNITSYLPKQLGDLEWLRNLNNNTQLPAATLITPNVNTSYSQPTVIEYPFIINRLENVKAQFTPTTKSIDVQLIILVNSQLQCIARNHINLQPDQQIEEKVKIEEEIKRWAKSVLRSKRNFNGAVVIQNFDLEQDILFIHPPLEALQEQLNNTPAWELEQEDKTHRAYYQEIDPRCRLPQTIIQDSGADKTKFSVTADSSLGLVLFDANPAIPDNSKLKSIAATRFRLAPTGNTSVDFVGKLRPAKISTVDSSQILACARWDEVPFEQYQLGSDGEPLYPKVNPRSIISRQFPLKGLPTLEREKNILPPLIDIVAWAARPGEMMRSLFSVNSISKFKENEQLYQLSGCTAVSSSLRRPRAVAGSDESVSLEVETSYPLFNNQFYYARLLITQVLGNTPIPDSDKKVYPVLATKNEFYSFNSNVDSTDTPPALIYYEVKPEEPEPKIEDVKLYLLANKEFKPQKVDANEKIVSITVVGLSSNDKLPNLTDDADIKKLVNNKDDNFVEIDSIPLYNLPSINDNDWILFATNTYKLENTKIKEELSTYISSESKSVNIILATYSLKDDNTWEEPTNLYVKKVTLLDKGSQIIAPKQCIALLVSPLNKPDEQVKLSGYGRLNDNDFSSIKPLFATDEVIKWARTANLQSIERISPDIIPNITSNNKTNEPYKYDIVFYGSGGELIPTKDSQKTSQ